MADGGAGTRPAATLVADSGDHGWMLAAGEAATRSGRGSPRRVCTEPEWRRGNAAIKGRSAACVVPLGAIATPAAARADQGGAS